MTKELLQRVFQATTQGQAALGKLTPAERTTMEREWDLEHTYYSSALEGSLVDREDVEKLSSAVK